MLYLQVSFEIAALSPLSRTGEMYTQLFERMKQVGALPCACIQHATNSRRGIPWDYFNPISNGFLLKGETNEQKLAEGRQKYDAALAARILSTDKERPELIILAGWMHVLSGAFLEPVERAGVRIINIHPALPRKF
jgi:Formyl transferase